MTKRSPFGNVRKLPSGRYQARYRDAAGRSQTAPITFGTEREARKYLALVQADLHRGEWTDPRLGRIPLAEWAAEWLSTTSHLNPRTRRNYESSLRLHVLPVLGGTPVGSVNQIDVRRLLSQMTAAGLARDTVASARKALRLVMAAAQGAGAMKVNPCDGVKIGKTTRREMHFLTAEQVSELAAEMGDYSTMIFFAAYTGMRAGEIEALRVSRLNLLKGTVDVVESLGEIEGEGLVFGPTKTYQRRTVRLPRFLCDMLAAHLAGRSLTPDSLVFTAPGGGPIRHHNFYSRQFRPAVKRIVERQQEGEGSFPAALRFHDLRHTCAALLVAQGAHPRAIMERLGHSSITVTLNTYGHLFPSIDEALTDRLEELYQSAQNRPIEAASGTQVARGDFGPTGEGAAQAV